MACSPSKDLTDLHAYNWTLVVQLSWVGGRFQYRRTSLKVWNTGKSGSSLKFPGVFFMVFKAFCCSLSVAETFKTSLHGRFHRTLRPAVLRSQLEPQRVISKLFNTNKAHILETSSGNYKIFLIILYMNGVSSAHHKVAASTPYSFVMGSWQCDSSFLYNCGLFGTLLIVPYLLNMYKFQAKKNRPS